MRAGLANEDAALLIVVRQQQSNYQLAAMSNDPLVSLPKLVSFIWYNKTKHIFPRSVLSVVKKKKQQKKRLKPGLCSHCTAAGFGFQSNLFFCVSPTSKINYLFQFR